jgi:hypothetical protein
MSTFNYLSNDVERNQVSQKTLSASVSVPGQDAGIDHNIATDALVISLPKIHSENLGMTFFIQKLWSRWKQYHYIKSSFN